jgi:hypothetical protein
MKHKTLTSSKIITCLLLLFFCSLPAADPLEQLKNSTENALEGIKDLWDGAGQFWEGLKGSVGFVDASYVYSFRVWNDSPAPIYAAAQQLTEVMGARFAGDIKTGGLVVPFNNSGGYFYDQRLFVGVWLCADRDTGYFDSYKNVLNSPFVTGATIGGGIGMLGGPLGVVTVPVGALLGGVLGGLVSVGTGIVTTEALDNYSILHKNIPLGSKNDKNVYHYRAYSDHGDIKAEYLGINTATHQFLGVFFNNTSHNDINLQFGKDGASYKVTLEAGTFSLLESTTSNPVSIRPAQGEIKTFTFSKADTILSEIPIGYEGLMSMVYDETAKKLVEGTPLLYTYEVYEKNDSIDVGLQGLSIGKYAQTVDKNDPNKVVIRDINPVKCHLWVQSAAQAQALVAAEEGYVPQYSTVFYDINEQIWIMYKTKDYILQKKVSPGAVVDFTLIRPLLSEPATHMYVVSLQTNDDAKAHLFLQRLADGVIGQGALTTTFATFDPGFLGKQVPNTKGMISDKGTGGSGINGVVMLSDTFISWGVGMGPFYYSCGPVMLLINQIAELMIPFLDATRFTALSDGTVEEAQLKELSEQFPMWITLYATDQEAAEREVKTYLQNKGIASLFTNPTAPAVIRTFNELGQLLLSSIISGPISLANPPYMRTVPDPSSPTSIKNWYAYSLDAKPAVWPQSK